MHRSEPPTLRKCPFSPYRPEVSELVAQWLAHYRPLLGTYDEMIGPDGKPRPHWHDLLGALAALD